MLKNCQCFFCHEIENRMENILGKNRVVLETEHFIVFPTVGCFTVGYLLIMPKAHYLCFGELSPEQLEEAQTIVRCISIYVKERINQDCVLFEHGTRNLLKLTSTSIMHAHIHIIPFEGDFVQCLPKNRPLKRLSDWSVLSETRENYLYFRNTDGTDYLIENDDYPSQFFRRILCDVMGIPQQWNWKEYPFTEKMEDTLCFYDKLPSNGGEDKD